MVEFALTVPILLMLLLGLIDLGRLTLTELSIVNGTRELARAAAIPGNSNSQVLAAFNNLAAIAGNTNPGTDHVVISVTPPGGAASSVTCALPLTTGTCAVPTRSGADDGMVRVTTTYRFVFLPLFQAPLQGMVDAGLLVPFNTLTTTYQTFVE